MPAEQLSPLCEVAAFYKLQNKTLCDGMEEVYHKYGYYFEDAFGKTLKGVDGAALISRIMENIRKDDLKEFAGLKSRSNQRLRY